MGLGRFMTKALFLGALAPGTVSCKAPDLTYDLPALPPMEAGQSSYWGNPRFQKSSSQEEVIQSKSQAIKKLVDRSPAGPPIRRLRHRLKKMNLDLDYRRVMPSTFREVRGIDFAFTPRFDFPGLGEVESRFGIVYPTGIVNDWGKGSPHLYFSVEKKW